MNTPQPTALKERKPIMTASTLIRLAGLSSMLAGASYVVVGFFHPLNILSSVTTPTWAIVHVFATALGFFGLFGMAGLYTRQAEKSGWLGLAGFILLSLWLAIVMCFSFVEAFMLPQLATQSPAFVAALLGMFTGSAGDINLGILPLLWTLSGPMYMLGGLLFGIATFRAGILPRGAAVILAFGTALAPIAALLPPEHEALITVPVGLGLAWLGYALFAERRATVSAPAAAKGSVQLRQTAAE